jgi:hypothetical protein
MYSVAFTKQVFITPVVVKQLRLGTPCQISRNSAKEIVNGAGRDSIRRTLTWLSLNGF